MQITVENGWLNCARRVPTTNCDERPVGLEIELLVVHGISLPPGEFGGPWIDDLFCNRLDSAAHPYFLDIAGRQVSAHVLIRRNGEVVQYVPFDQRAWHAGVSAFCGRTACNDFSIGIELEGGDDIPYEPVQYQTLASIIKTLQDTYPLLKSENIVGHSDIAPGRKTDPGPSFDWEHLRMLLA